MAGELIEEWRAVADYEGMYEVSSLGRVRSLDRYRVGDHGARTRVAGRILSQRSGNSGYLTVWLSKDAQKRAHSVHRLVAVAFLPGDATRVEVNHIDGIKLNNAVANLEWASRSENVAHAYRTVGRRGWKRVA